MAQEYKKKGGGYKGEKDESQYIQNWADDPEKERKNEGKNEEKVEMLMTQANCSRKRNLRNETDQLKNPTERSLQRKKRKPKRSQRGSRLSQI
jgi:hypothetical protein